MKTEDLNQLSIPELNELIKQACEVMRIKRNMAGLINRDKIKVGMSVQYAGNDKRVNNDTFTVSKINRTTANCTHNTTQKTWVIRLANIQPI